MNSKEETQDQNLKKFDLHLAEDETDFFGPALPPQFKRDFSPNTECRKIYGPILPNNLGETDVNAMKTSNSKHETLIGPELPEHLKSKSTTESRMKEETGGNTNCDDEKDDDNDFGPSTTLMAIGDATNHYTFKRAPAQNEKNSGGAGIERETWMIELPCKKSASFGLLPRHFKSKIQTDKESDSSVWTDTPADKEKKRYHKKKDHKDMLKMKRLQERDEEMEKLAKKAAKKLRKKESLLEIHLKNLKTKTKKKIEKREKEGSSLPERRPFDRNVDLQIRRFDENQKRAFLNKSQFLNDRFASGESKFL